MGKRTRKTRWRTLPIGDERSDSEESNSTLDTRIPPTYHQKYYSRLTYSSQSTPTRRYQSDSTKSTRSSSTTSENKITFNEDEYTRITTPRQDVLFKKGYLNKPKTYSTQTSTGNSTTSTGNSTTSTGNGTPDYQSTDLEYESHFVFPNGFMDQSGIYYVNSYDPYPLVVYNPPPYYSNETCNRVKKYSTESLTETTSTNEETSQDAVNHSADVQGEEVQHAQPPQVNGQPNQPSHIPPPAEYGQVYNVVYPGFYYNGSCPPQELVNGQEHQSEPKRIKKRRRRKLSLTKTEDQQVNGTTSEYTEDDSSEDEEERTRQDTVEENHSNEDLPTTPLPVANEKPKEKTETQPPSPDGSSEDSEEAESDSVDRVTSNQVNIDTTVCDTNGHQNEHSETQSNCSDQPSQTNTADDHLTLSDTNSIEKKVKYDLKPDAQEFIPRCLRPENVQFFKIPPNFVPVPLLNPIGAHNYNHPYLPTGIPVNFIHQNHAIYPGFVPGFVPPNFNPAEVQHAMNGIPNGELYHSNHHIELSTSHEANNKADVDIRTVVSKLEQVANEPSKCENSPEKRNRNSPVTSPKKLGSYKYYDERKKYNPKNNRQNGYFHKRPYNKYQTTGLTHNNYQCEEETADELEECSKLDEPKVIINDQQDTRKASQTTETKVEQPTPELLEAVTCQLKKSVLQNGVSDKETNTEETHTHEEMLSNTVSSREAGIIDRTKVCPNNGSEKIYTSPKFQQKFSKEKPMYIPKTFTKNSNNNIIDSKKRWPQRDEKNLPKWQPQIQQEDKTNMNFKQNESSHHKFNRKVYPNSPVRRLNNQNVGHNIYNDNIKKLSDSVKKIPQSSPTKLVIKENTLKNTQEIKPDSSEVNNTLISKTQWISVSNKKKRRNRNIEGSEDSVEILETSQESKADKFEQNDFLQNIIVNGHSMIDDIEFSRPSIEKVEQIPDVIRKSPVKILEVRDLEKELLSNVGVEIKEEEEIAEIDDKTVQQPTKFKSSSKKKSKKGNPKQPIKRIIITDADLSESISDSKSEDIIDVLQNEPQEVKEEEIAQNLSKEVPAENPEIDIIAIKSEVTTSTQKETIANENSEKKSKKKKKKQAKVIEISSSNTTLNSCEDTYDLLLENTFSTNSDDKTNMEISQELDLIIQRGMYSNLEEKIKSLNIIPIREEFFQNVVRNSREPSTEKTPEYSKFISNSMPKFKYCMATMGDDALKMPLSQFDQPSTSKDLFVENLEVNELLKDIYGTEETSSTEMKGIVKLPSPPKDLVVEVTKERSIEKNIDSSETSVSEIEEDKEKLYPITLAVKKWMTKTRENTPEVEILKSPSVIFKEFCEKPDSENVPTTNGRRNSSTLGSDEEVTVYSASRNNSEATDLLDCWENEISSASNRKSSIGSGHDTETEMNKESKEDAEFLEIYESKYGQNEDFLDLQKEIEDKKRQETDSRSRNFPKHGALPYRAICCNVM